MVETYLSSMMNLQERAAPSVPHELHALTGTYRDPKTAEIWRVAADGTELQVDFEGQPVQLRPLSSTEFEPVDYPFEVRLKFEPRAQNGSPRKLIVEREMELPATFEAVEVARPTVADLNACTGDYWSDELRATYRLAIKNEKLWMTDLIGADGVSHTGTVPFNALEPVRADEYTLSGAPITFHFLQH